MASTNSPTLIVGSSVSFTSRMSGEFYEGTVYFYRSEDASFGIENVSRTKYIAGYHPVQGLYQFFLKDIKDLKVKSVPTPKPTTTTTTTTTKDDQKNTPPGEASSSASASK